MSAWRRVAAIAVMTTLLAGNAGAVDELITEGSERREPKPREAITAALLNVVYLPVRLPLTILGAVFAGLTGFLTFGGEHAANDVFGLVDGTQVIDDHVLEGREPFCIGRYDHPDCEYR
jgi:hypothetical protein